MLRRVHVGTMILFWSSIFTSHDLLSTRLRHESSHAEEVCRSTKWMMLHVRDCPGTTITDDICPFPWCRKVKHLIYHLVSCTMPQECSICSGSELDYNWSRLRHLNTFRMKLAREKLIQGFTDRDSQQQWCTGVLKRPGGATAGTTSTVTAVRSLPPLLAAESVKVKAAVVNTVVVAGSSPRATTTQTRSLTPQTELVMSASGVPTSVVCLNEAAGNNDDGKAPTQQNSESDLSVKFDCDPEMTNGVTFGFVVEASPQDDSATKKGALVVPIAPTSGPV